MRFLKTLLPAAAFLGTTALAGPAGVKILKINYGGNGCPQGSVGKTIANDAESFTLIFDQYLAEIGPGVEKKENRKFCQITLDLAVPQGWSYSVGTFDYRGYAQLDAGVTATQTASYYYDGSKEGAWFTKLDGKYDKNYLMTDTIDFEDLIWSDCNAHRLLNIKTQIALSSRRPNGAGIMTTDSVDGTVKEIYGLQWRRCQ